MTYHRYSHTTTDAKPEMITGVQTGNGIPYYKYDIRGVAHARRNRKEDIFTLQYFFRKMFISSKVMH